MLTSGPTAVGYFFLLSGFVMALAYYRPGADFNFQNYWLSRFSRIQPVYILGGFSAIGRHFDFVACIWFNISITPPDIFFYNTIRSGG